MLHLLQPLSTSIQSSRPARPRRDDTKPLTAYRPNPLVLPSPHSPSPTSYSPSRYASPLAIHSSLRSTFSDSPTRSTDRNSWSSSVLEDCLAPGDLVGEGLQLLGEPVRAVPLDPTVDRPPRSPGYLEPAREFEVVKRLGTGSYAVVYLVREVLSRPAVSEDDHATGSLELDGVASRPSIQYGREYAIKCLSKANLDEDALAAQMSEVTIHQSLPSHPNIVTLHRTLETSSFLLLLLEFVPGEDLFYFLEQSRDHYDSEPAKDPVTGVSRTPPTPGILANTDQLLSRNRLRLIASMFAQMCDAVGTCHDRNVFHRDIKPENFIVTDGWVEVDGRQERKVIVKLSDFGLSTTDLDSADMDCGSAPYMSYECRNNIAPTYKPRAADVWSLGIVLINMLYHYNPWTDTTDGACSSFTLFRQHPVNFFLQRFSGMTPSVAEFLVNNVFCISDDPLQDPPRCSAQEFGAWVKDLPTLLCPASTHKRMPSMSSVQGHPICSTAPNSRPASRQASNSTIPRLSGSGAPTHSDEAIMEMLRESTLSPVIDEERENEELEGDGVDSRSASTKVRKRGKKNKMPVSPEGDKFAETLSLATQALARELSKTSRLQSPISPSVELPPMPPSVTSLASATQAPASPVLVSPIITKKPSKWKLSFGKASGDRMKESPTESSPVSELPVPKPQGLANNVANIIMGLDAPPTSAPSVHSPETIDERGRARKGNRSPVSLCGSGTWDPVPTRQIQDTSVPRALSPYSARGRQPASSASSTFSNNWRSSMSSAASSTSAFTRYSNGSRQSVSTVATSVSAQSWRTTGSKPSLAGSSQRARSPYGSTAEMPPRNVKLMDGVPWALHQLPRQMHQKPEGDIFGQPPAPRKQRSRKLGPSSLAPIDESAARAPGHRQDASTSTTDLEDEDEDAFEQAGPRKVQKGQINALAKMLSALRR